MILNYDAKQTTERGLRKARVSVFNSILWKAGMAIFLLILSGGPSFSIENGPALMNAAAMEKVDLQVSGKVTDVNGASLPGVNILYKNTTIGTVTDMEGNYSINVPENGTLVFSFIGYVTQEIPMNSRTTINVTMEESATALNEVIVTA